MYHKVLYYYCQVSMLDYLPFYNKAKFNRSMVKRASRFRGILSKLEWDENYHVVWQHATFVLTPPAPLSDQTHKYTHMKALGVEVELPTYLHITPTWRVRDNFSWRGARLQPPPQAKGLQK